MYVYYEHIRDTQGQLILTELRLSSKEMALFGLTLSVVQRIFSLNSVSLFSNSLLLQSVALTIKQKSGPTQALPAKLC